jgi:hypothetical protein
MKKQGAKKGTWKQRGELVEMRFMTRAAEHGLCVSKPWGDSSAYDFVLECEGGFVRVQVKSTQFHRHGGYPCVTRPTRGHYADNSFEFIAALVVPENVWYIIPAEKVLGMTCIQLCPHSERTKYSRYKEAWHLLRVGGRVGDIQASVEEQSYV